MSRNPLRLLHVIASLAPRYGGPSRALPELCTALADRGHEVEVLTTDKSGFGSTSAPLGVPTYWAGFTVTYHSAWPPRSYAFSPGLARELLRRVNEFDLVHVHSLYLFHTLAAGVACRRRGVPYVVRPHGTLDDYHRSHHRGRKALYDFVFERRNLDRAAGIHYTSYAEFRQAEAAGVRARGFVVPLGVRLPETVRPEARRNCRGLVLFIGRLTEKKGLDLLLQSFAEVADGRPRARLVIAGPDDDAMAARLRTHASALGLGERVVFTGFVDGSAKARLLEEASVFALPSADENFGVAVVEAMAAGVPVVVTPAVAIADEIARAEAGLVIPRDSASLTQALAILLDDPARADTLGSNGRSLAESAYSREAAAARLEKMYSEVLGSGSAPDRRPYSTSRVKRG